MNVESIGRFCLVYSILFFKLNDEIWKKNFKLAILKIIEPYKLYVSLALWGISQIITVTKFQLLQHLILLKVWWNFKLKMISIWEIDYCQGVWW